jgi:hypothetical protein
MLMANEQWVASECETTAEKCAAFRAEQTAKDIRFTAMRAREVGREDIAAAVEALSLTIKDAWKVLRVEKARATESVS